MKNNLSKCNPLFFQREELKYENMMLKDENTMLKDENSNLKKMLGSCQGRLAAVISGLNSTHSI